MFRKKPSNQIMHHVLEIIRIMDETTPDDAYLKGFQFRIMDGEPHQVWGSAQLANGNLTHIRPGVYPGWRESKLYLNRGDALNDGVEHGAA